MPPALLDRKFLTGTPSVRAQLRIVSLSAAKPGVEIANLAGHRHPGHVLVYVLEGTVRSKLDDGPETLYVAGQGWSEEPGQLHRILNPVANSVAKLLVITIDPAINR